MSVLAKAPALSIYCDEDVGHGNEERVEVALGEGGMELTTCGQLV